MAAPYMFLCLANIKSEWPGNWDLQCSLVDVLKTSFLVAAWKSHGNMHLKIYYWWAKSLTDVKLEQESKNWKGKVYEGLWKWSQTAYGLWEKKEPIENLKAMTFILKWWGRKYSLRQYSQQSDGKIHSKGCQREVEKIKFGQNAERIYIYRRSCILVVKRSK